MALHMLSLEEQLPQNLQYNQYAICKGNNSSRKLGVVAVAEVICCRTQRYYCLDPERQNFCIHPNPIVDTKKNRMCSETVALGQGLMRYWGTVGCS